MGIVFEKPMIRVLDLNRCTEDEYEKIFTKVSDERKARSNFFLFQSDSQLSIAGGYLFEQGMKELGYESYGVAYGISGKPYLCEPEGLYFSTSHSGTIAACAFFDEEIGLDIQQVREVSEKMIRKACTDKEYEHLMAMDEEARKDAFCRMWTIKESYVKYTGTGMSVMPLELEVDMGEHMTISHDGNIMDVVFEEYEIPGYHMTLCRKG